MASKKKRKVARPKKRGASKPASRRGVRKATATRARPASPGLKSTVMPSSPRHPWSVDYEIIRNLTETRLVEVVRGLIIAEATAVGLDISKVVVNSEPKGADGGCDAWSPKPTTASPWLGDSETCWQLKAGTAGDPSRLKGEVTKPEPRKTLTAGGRFVVVTSSAVTGEPGKQARLKILRAEAKRKKLPDDRIEVFHLVAQPVQHSLARIRQLILARDRDARTLHLVANLRLEVALLGRKFAALESALERCLAGHDVGELQE